MSLSNDALHFILQSVSDLRKHSLRCEMLNKSKHIQEKCLVKYVTYIALDIIEIWYTDEKFSDLKAPM